MSRCSDERRRECCSQDKKTSSQPRSVETAPAEKQQEIRQLLVTVRDLSSSRENWKTRVKELEQQLQAAHEAHAAVGPGSWIFFGGLMDNQAMPRTRRTPITLSSD